MSDSRSRQIQNLVNQLKAGGVHDERVLGALASVPREAFVPDELHKRAWENRALPIGQGQTISQPLIVGLMTQALALHDASRVLEIGTGSGYQAAILAELAGSVVSIERYEVLADVARERLSRLGYHNVNVVVGDGTAGWPQHAPYDRIIVTAAAPHLPGPLIEQLSPRTGSRIVIPIGNSRDQDLIAFERFEDELREFSICPVRFVPLIGEFGWHEPE